MSSTLHGRPARRSATAAERLERSMAAARVSLRWFGIRKSLTAEQKSQAADTFGAEGQYLSAGKKLLDNSHPAFRSVTSVKNRVLGYWKSVSLPYPEPGIRLIRQDTIESFYGQLAILQLELEQAVDELDEHYASLQSTARQRLGRLYNAGDYPESLRNLFEVSWDFPNVTAPEYLRQLSPELYAAEQARVSARFDEAVRLAEESFITELGSLVSHLTERITGQSDGKPKVFRDSAIENLSTFFERFRALNIRSSAELDELVDEAQRIVQGVAPQDLRDQAELRHHVANELTSVRVALDELVIDRPRRNILRRAK